MSLARIKKLLLSIVVCLLVVTNVSENISAKTVNTNKENEIVNTKEEMVVEIKGENTTESLRTEITPNKGIADKQTTDLKVGDSLDYKVNLDFDLGILYVLQDTITTTNPNVAVGTIKKPSFVTITAKGEGTATITITGKHKYTGETTTKSLTVKVTRIAVTKPTNPYSDITYDGNQHSFTLTANTGYSTTSVTNVTNVGEYTIKASLSDKNKYVWSDKTSDDVEYKIHINPASLSSLDDPVLDKDSFFIDEDADMSSHFTITGVKGNALTSNDYDLSGTYKVDANTESDKCDKQFTVTGKGNYTGSVDITWHIVKRVIHLADVSFENPTYDGTPQSPEVTVTVGGTKLTEGTDYSVTLNEGQQTNHKTSGYYLFSIQAAGSYELGDDMTAFGWNVEKAKVEEPTKINDLVYNGSSQTGVTCDLSTNSKYTLIEGSISETDAGSSYQAKFDLKDKTNYEWKTAENTEAVTVNWSIAKKPVTKPSLSVNDFKYTGGEISVTDPTYDTSIIEKVTGAKYNNKGTEPGTYYLGFKIKDTCASNYAWSDSSTGVCEVTWTITGVTITKTINIQVNQTTDAIYWKDYRTVGNGISNPFSGASSRNNGIVSITEEKGAVSYIKIKGLAVGTTVVEFKGDKETVYLKVVVAPLTDIQYANISITNKSFTYDGNEHGPTIVVKNEKGEALTLGTDYRIVDGKKTDAGDYTVKIQGIGKYNGEVTDTYVINKATVSVSISGKEYTYNGTDRDLISIDSSDLKNATLEYYVKYFASIDDIKKLLDLPTSDSDWSSSLPKGKDAGIYYVFYRVKGKNWNTLSNYTSTKINRYELTKDNFFILIDEKEVSGNKITFDGEQHTAKVICKVNGTKVSSHEYNVVDGSILKSSAVGTHIIVVSLEYKEQSNYTVKDGVFNMTWEIEKKALNNTDFVLTCSKALYEGTGVYKNAADYITSIKYGNYILVKGTDYEVINSSYDTEGKHNVTIKAKDNSTKFTGQATFANAFELDKSDLQVVADVYDGVYDGTAHNLLTNVKVTTVPSQPGGATTDVTGATVKYSIDGGKTWLTEIPFGKNVNEYTVTYYISALSTGGKDYVGGTGSITGAKITQAEIKADTLSLENSSFTYDSLTKTIKITVKSKNGLTLSDKDYTIEGYYSAADVAEVESKSTNAKANYIDGNKYKFTITGTGNFKGTASGEWEIKRLSIADATVIQSLLPIIYDGNKHSINITTVLVGLLPASYKLEYSDKDNQTVNPTDAGTYTAKISGTGNFNGEKEVSWSILQTNIKVDDADISHLNQPIEANGILSYTSEAQQLIKYLDATLIEGIDGDFENAFEFKLGVDGEWTNKIEDMVGTDAGLYTVYYRVKGDKNHVNFGYIVEDFIVVTIKKAIITKLNFTIELTNDMIVDGDVTSDPFFNPHVQYNGLEVTALLSGTYTYKNAEGEDCTYDLVKGTDYIVYNTFLYPSDFTATNVGTYAYYVSTIGCKNFEDLGGLNDIIEVYWFIDIADTKINFKDETFTYNFADQQLVTLAEKSETDPKGPSNVDGVEETVKYLLSEEELEYPLLAEGWTDDITDIKAKDAGTYYVYYTVQGTLDYKPIYQVKTVVIEQAELDEEIEILGTYTYTGEDITVVYDVYCGEDHILVKDTDYELAASISDTHKDADDYTLTVDGIGNFKGSATATWTIEKAEIQVDKADIGTDNQAIEAASETFTYNKEDQQLVELKDDVVGIEKIEYSLDNGTTWTEDITEITGKDVGTYFVDYRITGDDNHNDYSDTIAVEIVKAEINVNADKISQDNNPIEQAQETITYNAHQQSLVKFLDDLDIDGISETNPYRFKLGVYGNWTNDIEEIVAKDAGEYRVYYQVDGDKNHKNYADGYIDVEIKKYEIKEDDIQFIGYILTEEVDAQGKEIEQTQKFKVVVNHTLETDEEDIIVEINISADEIVNKSNVGAKAGKYELTIQLNSNHKNYAGTASKLWGINGKNVDDEDNDEYVGSYEIKNVVLDDENVVTEEKPIATISTTDFNILDAIATPEDLSSLAKGNLLNIILNSTPVDEKVIEQIHSEIKKDEIEKAAPNYTIGAYIDITLFKQTVIVTEVDNGGNIERTEEAGELIPIRQTAQNKKIRITVAVDEKLINTDDTIIRTYKIVRVHNNGTEENPDYIYEMLDATFDSVNKTLTFETDKFSTFTIVYRDRVKANPVYDVKYVWADDFKSCSATYFCVDDNSIELLETKVSIITVDPVNGYITYEAIFDSEHFSTQVNRIKLTNSNFPELAFSSDKYIGKVYLVDGTIKVNTKLVVIDAKLNEEDINIDEEKYNFVKYINMYLETEDGTIVNLEGNSYKIQLTCPEEFKEAGKQLIAVVNGDNTITEIEAVYDKENNTLTFVTDVLGNFALLTADVQAPVDEHNHTLGTVSLILVVALLIAYIVLKKKAIAYVSIAAGLVLGVAQLALAKCSTCTADYISLFVLAIASFVAKTIVDKKTK